MCLFPLQLDKIEGVFERPNDDVIREISKALRQALGVSLFGIDIIINNQTGQHAVIDINAFPGKKGLSAPALWSKFYCCCLMSLLPRLGVRQQQPDGSEIKYRSVWEGKNPNLDVEFATEISALRRYSRILVASSNIAVVPSCANGSSRTAVWTVCWDRAFMGLAVILK